MIDDGTPPARAALVAGVIFEAFLLVTALALGAIFEVPPLATLRLDAADAALGAAAAAPLLAVFLFFLKSRLRFLVEIREILDRHMLPIFRAATTADLLALSCLAGLGEELLFRGLLQAAVAETAGTTTGLVVASAIFGLAHSVTRGYTIVATAVGFVFGGLWLATGNLLAPIVAHALYDFVALLLYVRDARLRNTPA